VNASSTIHAQITEQALAYPVYVGWELLKNAEVCRRHIAGKQVVIVTNQTIASLHLVRLQKTLSDFAIQIIVLPDGEQYKTLIHWQQIIDQLVASKQLRDTTIIALGGGVIGDMAGFAAACYMRGVRLIQVPTTLLAQVDSAIGGKTGVNQGKLKNAIGAFYQPTAVVCDVAVLATLPEREYRSGLAEVIKYGLIADADFVDWLLVNHKMIAQRQTDVLSPMIKRCISHKLRIVEQDVLDHGLRQQLNFGHTFAHAIESLTEYQHYLHGEAVAIGMMMASRFSHQNGLIDAAAVKQIDHLLHVFGLPTRLAAALSPKAFIEAMQKDKKNKSQGMPLILLQDIGAAKIVHAVDLQQLQGFLKLACN